MKVRKMLALLLALVFAFAMAACSNNTANDNNSGNTATQAPAAATQAPAITSTTVEEPEVVEEVAPAEPSWYEAYGLDENLRFTETKKITVEVYRRDNDGGSDPANNFYTNFIKEGMLRDHNVEITFVPVGRWTEVDDINNLLAASDAPDVCVTYNQPTIQNYSEMGAVVDMSPYFNAAETKQMFPNLWKMLGNAGIRYNESATDGTIYNIQGVRVESAKSNTFIREDWLAKLNMQTPTTLEEFETMLYAFKDNAELLLGADADQMIPFTMSYDVSWRAITLVESFLDENINDKDSYVLGFGDRHVQKPGYKEAIRVLNKWYNDGLIWKDFAMYDSGSLGQVEDNLMKTGVVGSLIHNYDYPYREADNGIQASLYTNFGQDADYLAIETFKNNAGLYRKYMYNTIGSDRKIFFPITNEEPLASLLYLDWLCKYENYNYLQIGEEGINHETLADGTIKTMGATGDRIMNSGLNIDYTLVMNGLNLDSSDATSRALSYNLPPAAPRLVATARNVAMHDGRFSIPAPPSPAIGAIESEAGIGPVLDGKRDVMLATAVTAKPEDFDKVFDSAMDDYLKSGAQAIADERLAKWEAVFGDATMLPQN